MTVIEFTLVKKNKNNREILKIRNINIHFFISQILNKTYNLI